MDAISIRMSAADLDAEMNWLARIIDMRIRLEEGLKTRHHDAAKFKPPSLERSKSGYGRFVTEHGLSDPERFLLILAVTPHIRPGLLDVFAGWMRGKADKTSMHAGKLPDGTDPSPIRTAVREHSGFIPTGETALFLYAGDDLEKRLIMLEAFNRNHIFSREQVLRLDEPPPGEPMLMAKLRLSDSALRLFTTGEEQQPGFDPDFPAVPLSTDLSREDLIHSGHLRQPLGQIEAYLKNRETLDSQWREEKHHRPGLNVLFYGPAGTGKTLAASLLSKFSGVYAYRIDLSAVISKYIGETEKNLSRIFEKAENREIILFFDEADALFGKRTEVRDSHDRYANLQTFHALSLFLSYLDQYPGLAILCVDDYYRPPPRLQRHFHISVHFSLPGVEERLQLWEKGFGKQTKRDRDVDLKHLAASFELSGGSIMNAIRFAILRALHRKSMKVALADILEGIAHHKDE